MLIKCLLIYIADMLETPEFNVSLAGSETDLEGTREVEYSTGSKPADTLLAEDFCETFRRPKSHSVVASNFLSKSNFPGANSDYSEILNRNVRLWKCRNAHAQMSSREVTTLEEEA